MQYILVVGDPVNGIDVYGVFYSVDAAEAFVPQVDKGGTHWWVTELKPAAET
jgi:hypothetical protein